MDEQKTKHFHFTADIEFDAEDIDDAFRLISTHFKTVGTDEEMEDWFRGSMNIHPHEFNPEE